MEAAGDEIEVGVTDLRAHLGHYLGRVEAGESLIVTRHGKPVARLAPMVSNANRLG